MQSDLSPATAFFISAAKEDYKMTFRRWFLTVFFIVFFVIPTGECACHQGQPATCAFAYGNTATYSSTNKINPCIDYVELIGLSTGYESLVATRLLHQLSEPSPTTFCFNYACGGWAHEGWLASIQQVFNGTCSEGYYGSISAACQFKFRCFIGPVEGSLIYNLGPNQTSGSLAPTLSVPGPCLSSNTAIYPSDYSYVSFERSARNPVDPIFDYTLACSACPIGYSCPAGTRLLSDATACPPGYFCPGGKKQACPAGTFVSTYSATRTTVTGCSSCGPGTYSTPGSGSCLPCPSGFYGPNNGMGECLPCPTGTFSPTTGQTDSSTCTACPANQFSQSGASSCASCPSDSPFLSASAGCLFQQLTLGGLAPVQSAYISNQGETKKTHAVSRYSFLCLVTASGKLLFWDRFTGSRFFLSPPVLHRSSPRFISVYVTLNQVIAELDNGGIVSILYDRFSYNDNFAFSDSTTVWGYLPGPFLQVVTFGFPPNGAPPTQCALRADGEIQCWKWIWNIFAAPFIPESGGYRDFTNMTAPASLCGASCMTKSGPYRDLVAFNRFLDSNVMTLCAIRVSDNFPFCTSTTGSFLTIGIPFLLPDLMPLTKFLPAPYNVSAPIKSFRIVVISGDTMWLVFIPLNETAVNTRLEYRYSSTSLSLVGTDSASSSWKDVTFSVPWNFCYGYSLIISNMGAIGRSFCCSLTGYFFSDYSRSGILSVSFPPYQDCDVLFCIQTDTGTLECYKEHSLQTRDDSPLAPSHPIRPIAFAGLRQRDTVCMLLPIIFDWTTWTKASIRTHFRCFGDGNLDVQFPKSFQMEQISSPNLASSILSVGEDSICAILPKGNVNIPSCWGGCIDTVKFGTTCTAPSSVNSSAIYLGSNHTCVINGDSNKLTCFGKLPGGVQPPQLPVFSASATSNMTCAILAVNQSLYCFGATSSIIPSVTTASLRSSLGSVAASVSATDGSSFFISTGPFKIVVSGGDFICALPSITSVPLCIGSNSSGQLSAPSIALTTIACGAAHCCGIVFSTASVTCWGSDSAGQVSGALSFISSGESFSRITATLSGSCGITLSGYIRCWGSLAKYVDSVAFPYSIVTVRVNATIYVGLPGGNDNACKMIGGGGSCATLAGAVNALTSSVSVIAVYGSGPSAPFEIPSFRLPGLVITGFSTSSDGSLPIISFTGTPTNGNIITLSSTAVVISNLILDGSSTMNCSNGIYISSLYDYIQNVTLRNFNCKTAVITATLSTAAVTNVFSTVSFDTLLIQNVIFESISAPVFIRSWGQLSVKLDNVIANLPVTPSVFLFVTEAQRLNLTRVSLSGFFAPPLLNLPLTGLLPTRPCGVGVTAMNTPSIEISKSYFSNMTGNSLTSVLCINGTFVLAVQVSMTSTRITNVSAAGPGAAMHITGAPAASIFISSSSFSRSMSLSSGGSLFSLNSDIFTLVNVTFDFSSSSGNGGAISVMEPRMFSASGVRVDSAQSYNGHGGGVYVSDFEVANFDALHVKDSKTDLGSGGGAAMVCSSRNQCVCNVHRSSFTACASPLGFGGGVSAVSTSSSSAISLSLTSTTITECIAGLGGGGVSFNGGNSPDDQHLKISITFFHSNEAVSGSGGAIYVNILVPAFISISITSSSFVYNKAFSDGGAIFTVLSTVTIRKSQFSSNLAHSGGAISTRNSILYLESCSFESNSALISGGAIAVFSCVLGGLETIWVPLNPPLVSPAVPWDPSLVSSHDASGTVFINNTARSVGGAVYTSGCSMSLSFITLLLNKATSGGGIFVDSPAASNVVNIGPMTAFGNEAQGAGGGAIVVSLSATQATTFCPRTSGINTFAFAGWITKSWNLSASIAHERSPSSASIFSTHTMRNVGRTFDTILNSNVPDYFPSQSITTNVVSSGPCPMPLVPSTTIFYSTVSTDSLFVSYPFSSSANDLFKPFPSSLPPPRVWLDSGSVNSVETLPGSLSVTRWQDLSGNNYHALAPFGNIQAPLYSTSTLGVQFTGSLFHYLRLPDGALPSGNSPYTYFIVSSFSGFSSNQGLISGGNAGTNGHYFVLLSFSNNIYTSFWSDDFVSSGAFLSSSQIQLIESTYKGGSAGPNSRSTSINQNEPTFASANVRFQGTSNNALGMYNNGNYLTGYIYEILIFNTMLTSTQVSDVRSYLSTKWGNTSSLASSTSFPDSSGNSNSLTLPKGLRPSPLGALFFSFNGQSATIPPANAANLTISLVYTWEGSEGVTIRALISSSYENFIFIAIRTVDGIIGFVSNGAFIASTVALLPRVQYGLALVAQNLTFTLFVNGTAVLRSSLGFNAMTRSPTILGNSATGLQTALGRFDDVRIWTRALTEQELASYNLIRIREVTTQNETVIFNQTTPYSITTSYNESGTLSGQSLSFLSCNTTVVSTYSTPVLAQDTFADSTFPYSCIFAGNTASNNAGLGGDLLFSQSIESGSAVSWSNSLSIGSSSGLGGGSAAFIGVDAIKLSNLVINSSTAGSSTRGSDGFDGSNGGALMIQKPLSASIVDSAFSQSSASSGGAIWLQSRLSYPISSTTRLTNILFNSNQAFYGGGDIYADANTLPSCLNCSLESYSTASYYGPRSATGPRLARLLSSPYLQPFGSLSSALVVVGSIAVLQPLVQIELIDALGQRVTSDNRSTCLISAVRNDTGGLLSLGFSSTYTSIDGIISIFPFSVNNGPGVGGLITMSCTTASDSFLDPLVLPLLSLPIGTSIVTVAWTEETLSAPIYFLSSTSDSPKPPSSPIKVKLIDGSGSTITSISVRCYLSITQSKNSFGAQTIASLEGFGNEVATTAGIAFFSPAIKANSNSSILLSASCTWISGDVVSVSIPLLVRTYALSLMWSGGDVCNCSSSGSGVGDASGSSIGNSSSSSLSLCESACFTALSTPSISALTDSSKIFMSQGEPWLIDGNGANIRRLLPRGVTSLEKAFSSDVPSALPSSSDLQTLQPLLSAPSLVIVRSDSNGSSPLALISPSLQCFISVDPSFTLNAFSTGAGNSVSGLTFVPAPISNVVGTSSLSSTNGRITFDNIGLTGTGFGSVVPLSALCTWLTGEVITSPILLARTNRLRARLLSFPPSSVLPSSDTQSYILSPFPSIVIESCLSLNCSMQDSFTPFTDVSLACTVSPFQINPISGLPITNTGIKLLGTLTSRTDLITATATFQRLSAIGPFDSAFYMSFACPWISGDVALGVSIPILIAAVFTSWASGGDVNSTVAISTNMVNEPPQSCLFNTPFTIGVQLKFALPATSVSLYPPKQTNWYELTDNPSSELLCSLAATGLGAPVLMTGLTTAQASQYGLALFPSIALLPALPSSVNDPEQIVLLTATCFARGNVLPTVQASISIQRLSVKLLQRPPSNTLPASVAQPLPFSPLVVVALINSSGTILTSESSATCTVSVASQSFAPFVPISNQQITLLGVMRSAMSGGVASFPGLSINGPLGSSADLNFDCSRSVGGIVFGSSSTVVVNVIQATWQPPLLSFWQLYNTPSPVSALLQQFVPDPLNGWTVAAGSLPQPSPDLTCSLELSSLNGASGLRISSAGNAGSSSKSSTGTSDQNGTVSFSLSLTGPPGNTDNVSALCSVAGQSFSTPLTPIAIETVVLVAFIPPPTVWLPSFSIARTPFSPAPKVLFTTKHGGIPVDAREASCQMSIDSPNATILEPPLAGYKLPPLRITASVDSFGSFVTNETDILYQAMNTPIVLTNALIQSSSFGLILPMNIICKRSQGDETAPYSWNLRLVDADVEYIKPPPSSIISQSAFSLYLRLFDRGAVATATSSVNEVGSSLTYPTIELDNVTTCSLSVTTQDSLIILQNGVARSINGVVSFLGVSLAARSGSEVKGIITCSLGDLMYPTKLSWSITMQPCGPGTAPAGASGYTCATCPSGTYSDGGVGVTACTPCPGQGVSCAGGLLVLLPGFSRTQDNAVTIDSSTELYPCWAIDGCWVNLNTSDRKRHANYTHGCIKGYGGPLCGVCSVKERYAQSGGVCVPCLGEMLNLVVVSFIPVIVAILVVWISFYRKVEESSKMQILLRIVLTYFQTLGTLSSIYSARGTIQFRAIFGFTTAVGDSPLTLTPIQCTLRLPYYVRFGITISLPFSIAVLVLLANLIALAYARFRSAKSPPSSRSLIARNSSTQVEDDEVSIRAESSAIERSGRGGSFRDISEAQVLSMTKGASGYFAQLRADIARFFISQAWVAPVIFVLNASYSSLTTTCFSMFNCLPFSVGGTTYLAQDLSVSCYDSLHDGFRALAGLLIAFFGAGFPILFAMILRRHRAELQKPEVFARLGFLYDGYTVERGMYMWESVVMVRKAAVVMIGSLIKDEYRQIFAAVTLLVFSLFLQANFQPYQTRLFNIIECVSLVTIILTQLVSMFYLRTESQMKQCMGESDVVVIDLQGTTCAQVKTNAASNDTSTTVLLAFINVVFIIVCLYLAYTFYKESRSSEDNVTTSTSLLVRSFRDVQRKIGAFNREKPTTKKPVKFFKDDIEETIENPLMRMRKVDSLSSSSSSSTLISSNSNKQLIKSGVSESISFVNGGDGDTILHQKKVKIDKNVHQHEDSISRPTRSVRSTDASSKMTFSPMPVVLDSLESNNHYEESAFNQESSPLSRDEGITQANEREDEEDMKDNNNNADLPEIGHNLPPHWHRRTDNAGDVWYENAVTGALQWEPPLFEGEDLSNLWFQRSDHTGDIWFENVADSSLVEWELPEGGRIIEEED